MRFSLATWNINSARLRAGLIQKLLGETGPDVLCLQEIKSPVEKLPYEAFAEVGYGHVVARGQPGYNGVAILSRTPIEDAGHVDYCGKGDARHVAARVALDGGPDLTIHNLYVPAGGDEPNPETNDKFDHKLRFVDEMAEQFTDKPERSILVGDLNIAPLEHDVWSHKQLLKVVSHTPIEVEKFEKARAAGGWIDAGRQLVPDDEKLYSWWSYRAKDWSAADKGRRLDHIWLSGDLGKTLQSSVVLREARGWEKPSDHAPVFATLAF